MSTLLVVHLIATAYMTGLIWLVQIVHYPLMARVGDADYAVYQRAHMRLITPVVLPVMVVELFTSLWIAYRQPDALAIAGAVLVVIIWISTFALQVPCHARLEKSFDAAAHRRLVATNWIRTIGWTARTIIAALLLTASSAHPVAGGVGAV